MPEAQVIEIGPGGRAEELQMMDFEELPRRGDFLTIQIGSIVARYVVDSIVHKVVLGRKNRIVVRVRVVDVSKPGMPPQRMPMGPALPQAQPMALPPADMGVLEETVYKPAGVTEDDDWLP